MPWLRATDGGVELDLWVTPGGSRTTIVGLHGDALRIRIAAPPSDGAANRALVALLEEVTGGDVELVHGRRSRRKTALVSGVAPETVRSRLVPPSP